MTAETLPVVQKAYDWTLWIIPKVEKLPKSQRFTIGQPLVNSSLDLLLHLVDAAYQTRNTTALTHAIREINRIRYLTRLAKDLRLINLDAHEFAAKSIDEIGRMAGGWRKSSAVRGDERTPPNEAHR